MERLKVKFMYVLLLSLVSGFLIFFKFSEIPKNLSFDEVEFGRLAFSLDGKPYIPYSPLATGHSTLYFYVILLSFKIFGISNFALRLPSALFGVLNILLFYLIIKRIFYHRNKSAIKQYNNIAIVLSFIFLTIHWYLNFTRFAFEATFLLFLELTSIYFLLKIQALILVTGGERSFDFAQDKRESGALANRSFSEGGRQAPLPIYLILSGLFAGLAFNSYTPGRIFFLLPLSFLLYSSTKQYSNIAMKQLFLFIIPFLIIITPLSLYLSNHQDTRINQVSYIQSSRLSIQKKAEYFGQNVVKTALMFNFKGDLNGRQNYPGKPALNPLLGTLFIVGLLLTIKQWNNMYNKFFILYFLISIFPALLTYPWENPHMLRTFTAIPSVVYFIGTAIYYLLKRFKRRSAMIIIFILIILSSVYELRTYFVYQNQVFPHAFEMKGELKQWVR